MASKRQILEAFSRAALQQLTASHELEVRDRRSKAALVDALISARRIKVEEILATMSQADLQALSATLGLPPGPKMKSKLIPYIAQTKPAASGRGRPRKKSAK